jgi:hypothetical protein
VRARARVFPKDAVFSDVIMRDSHEWADAPIMGGLRRTVLTKRRGEDYAFGLQ